MIAVGMIFLVLLVLLIFTLSMRATVDQGPDTRSARLEVFQQRRAELDAELSAGTHDPDRYAEAINELENAAARELGEGEGTRHARYLPATLGTIAVVLPLIAFGLYQNIGTGTVHERIATGELVTGAELPDLVAQLTERMAERPDDLQGWMLLGRSSVVLGRYTQALDAWRQAARLALDDPTVLANLAEALVLVDEAALQGEAGMLFERVLEIDPENPKALWYGGIAADQAGNTDLAENRWRALLAQDPPAEFRAVIEGRLGRGFELEVAISFPRIMNLDEYPYLFVTLHSADAQEGPPLAARRLVTGSSLDPILIGQSHVMLPATRLNPSAPYRVTARLSRDGNAQRGPGDPTGVGVWKPGDTMRMTVELVTE